MGSLYQVLGLEELTTFQVKFVQKFRFTNFLVALYFTEMNGRKGTQLVNDRFYKKICVFIDWFTHVLLLLM